MQTSKIILSEQVNWVVTSDEKEAQRAYDNGKEVQQYKWKDKEKKIPIQWRYRDKRNVINPPPKPVTSQTVVPKPTDTPSIINPPTPTPTPLPSKPNVKDFDKDIVKVAEETSFYDNSDRLIKWLSPVYNDNFYEDTNVINRIKLAEKFKARGDEPITAYLKAVVTFGGNQVRSFSTKDSTEITKEIEKLINNKVYLDENKTIEKLTGLKTILFEQTRYVINQSANQKRYVGGKLNFTDRGNVFVDEIAFNFNNDGIRTFAPFSYNNGIMPDHAPIVAEVKIKLKDEGYYTNKTDFDKTFNKDLNDAISKYRKEKGLSYSLSEGDIDFTLIKKLFPNEFKKEEIQTTTVIDTPPDDNFKYENIIKEPYEISKRMNKSDYVLNFDDCKRLFTSYPNAAIKIDREITARGGNSKQELKNSERISSIHNALKYCKKIAKGRTKVLKTLDDLNVFERGAGTISRLPEPFGLKDF